jgi:ribosomal protein S18 acetylase RimI-like enzyme
MQDLEAERLHTGLKSAFQNLFGALGGTRIEPRLGYVFVVSLKTPVPAYNGVWAEGPREDVAMRELRDAIEEVECFGLPSGLMRRAGRGAIIAAEARRIGLTKELRLPAMVTTPDELFPTVADELEIDWVKDEESLDHARRVALAGFGRGSLSALYVPEVVEIPGVRIYVGRVDGEPVTTALAWTAHEATGIFQVATQPESRGHGYGGAVTSRAVSDGFASGADLAWLQTYPGAEALYRELGFRQVETYLLLTRS